MHSKTQKTTARVRTLDAPVANCHPTEFAHLTESLISLRAEISKLSRLVKSYLLRPGPGRPRHPKITLAVSMRTNGKGWREIFAMCLPDRVLYDSSDAYRNAKQGLKKAVRLREKRTQASEQLPEPSVFSADTA
jgi:anthranilate/para-aminobenzoate synthase component II